MRIAACIPTRGDQDLTEILESLPPDWERVIYDNSVPEIRRFLPGAFSASYRGNDYDYLQDFSVYGRYVAIQATPAEIIYTQDDDVILDPDAFEVLRNAHQPGVLTANMPPEFRHDFYREHCLVGFGAIFDRDLPQQAFDRYFAHAKNGPDDPLFRKNCDVVFTALTTRHLVAVGKTDMPWASNPERMWKQPDHQTSRSRTLQLAIQAR